MAKRNRGRNRNKARKPGKATAPARTAPTPAPAQPAAPSAPPRRSQAQKRAEHALEKIRELEGSDYGNYAAYVRSLPARIIMNGLGQALAMERAGAQKDAGHRLLFAHMQDWLLNGWAHSPHRGSDDILAALAAGPEADYIRTQGEAMAYLEWLRKFAAAFLKEPDDGEGNDAAPAA